MTLLVQRQPDLKCVVVGDDSVGKTSMLMGYATNRYPTQHVPSAFDNYAGKFCIEFFFSIRRLISSLVE